MMFSRLFYLLRFRVELKCVSIDLFRPSGGRPLLRGHTYRTGYNSGILRRLGTNTGSASAAVQLARRPLPCCTATARFPARKDNHCIKSKDNFPKRGHDPIFEPGFSNRHIGSIFTREHFENLWFLSPFGKISLCISENFVSLWLFVARRVNITRRTILVPVEQYARRYLRECHAICIIPIICEKKNTKIHL